MQEAKELLFEFKEEVNTFVWRWRRWDVRADGKVFWQYTPNLKTKESWVTWESAISRNESVKKAASKQRAKNPEKHKLSNKRWRERNPDRHTQNAKDYYQKNKKHANEVKRKRRAARRKEDPLYAFECNIRSLVSQSFRDRGYSKKSKTKDIIGCDLSFFKIHIESQFVDGMNWLNRGQWHIDHIIPLASAKSQEDIVRLNHYTNLRPLWALDNLKKGAKVPPAGSRADSVLIPQRRGVAIWV